VRHARPPGDRAEAEPADADLSKFDASGRE
jgi:hypothetical protein